MTVNEPEEPIVQEVEQARRRIRPLQRLLLLDVFRDKESRPVFYWAGGMLLGGVLVYHWLEGWSYLDALYFCVVSLATVGYGDLTPTTPLGQVIHHYLSDQRHRHPAGAVRPSPRCARTRHRESRSGQAQALIHPRPRHQRQG